MSTVYDVKIQYTLDDKASNALTGLSNKAEETEKHLKGLHEGFKHIAEFMLGREAFMKGKELFIDINSEFEQMKISMGGIAAYNLGKPFEAAADNTDRLIEGWQQFSKQTTLTTREITEFGSRIAPGVFASGGTERAGGLLDQITKRGAVVGKAIAGQHAGGLGYVGMEINEALMGNLRRTQMFNVQLLGPAMRKAGKELEDFNKMSAKERAQMVLSALNDPAWQKVIERQANSFEGVTSTFRDNMEIAARQIGLPLFKAISAEVGNWNKWLDQHPKEIEEFATKFGQALVDGFKAIKDAIGWVVAHKDMLMDMGKLFLALKGVNMAVGGIQASGLGKSLGMLENFAAGGEMTFSGLLGSVTNVTMAMGGLYVAAQALADYFDREHKKTIDKSAEHAAAVDAFKAAEMAGAQGLYQGPGAVYTANSKLDQALGQVVEVVHQAGAYTKDAEFNQDKFTQYLNSLNVDPSVQAGMIDVAKTAFERFNYQSLHEDLPNIFYRLGLGNTYTGTDKNLGKGTGKTEVTIHKIEVASDDPDRFVFGMVGAFEKINRAPTQAEAQLRGGA